MCARSTLKSEKLPPEGCCCFSSNLYMSFRRCPFFVSVTIGSEAAICESKASTSEPGPKSSRSSVRCSCCPFFSYTKITPGG